jgi:DNA-binding IclR family transcriptional regulator
VFLKLEEKTVRIMNQRPGVNTVATHDSDNGEMQGAQTLRRGLSVLKLLTRAQPNGLRMSEIGRRLGLSKATAVRLTRTLVDERFAELDPATRNYTLGPEAFAVGLAAEPSYLLQRIAAPHLRALALQTGDWVYFSVKHGFEAICLSRESGDIPIPATALKVGDRHPLGIGAGGLAILSALPDEEVERALSHNADVINQNYPQCTVPVVRQLVAETREKGYSVLPGLIVPDYWALAVPLVQRNGRPQAAISLVASSSRLHLSRRAALGERLIRLSRELMARVEESAEQ